VRNKDTKKGNKMTESILFDEEANDIARRYLLRCAERIRSDMLPYLNRFRREYEAMTHWEDRDVMIGIIVDILEETDADWWFSHRPILNKADCEAARQRIIRTKVQAIITDEYNAAKANNREKRR